MNNTKNVVEFLFDKIQVRVVMIAGDTWFVGKDVAEVLGYNDTDQALRKHCKAAETYPVEMTGQVRHIKMIPERDVYRLIMRSKKKEAQEFEEWVVGTVIPTIRKTGGYMLGEEHVQSEEELVFMAMQVMQRKIEAMKPKAEYHDNWMSAEGSYTTTEVAKKLGITAQKLNKFLREEGVKWQKKDLPKSGYEDWFKVIDRQYDNGFNSQVAPQCRVSPEGVSNIINLYEAKAA